MLGKSSNFPQTLALLCKQSSMSAVNLHFADHPARLVRLQSNRADTYLLFDVGPAVGSNDPVSGQCSQCS
jgi:hypothetical protein